EADRFLLEDLPGSTGVRVRRRATAREREPGLVRRGGLQREALEGERYTGVSRRRQDPAPIGVATVDGGFDERRSGDRPPHLPRRRFADGARDLNLQDFGRPLAV